MFTGFEITVDHPHTHIVKTCNLVRGMLYSCTVIKFGNIDFGVSMSGD